MAWLHGVHRCSLARGIRGGWPKPELVNMAIRHLSQLRPPATVERRRTSPRSELALFARFVVTGRVRRGSATAPDALAETRNPSRALAREASRSSNDHFERLKSAERN